MITLNIEDYTDTYQSAQDIQIAVDEMRAYFRTGATLDLKARKQALRDLYDYLQKNENLIYEVLHADLGKAPQESYATELGIVLEEISTCLKKLSGWARPKWVPTPLAHFPSTSKVYPSPFGVAAVLSPWNYPVQLALVPLVNAIAAGNCVILKPSHTSVHTSAFLAKLCKEVFSKNLVRCLPGGGDMNDWILQVHFDKIFFTGSPRVGREIMTSAAKNLTDVTLELGGKSPCIIAADANAKRVGQRVAWGKAINSGQTCVAPDYLLVHESRVDEVIKEIGHYFCEYYGEDILSCDWYPHMINKHHFERVCGLIDNRNPKAKIVFGGGRDEETLRIEPTIITGITFDDPIMGEEIFGPVLPVITWRTYSDIVDATSHYGHPLACYIFSESKEFQRQIIDLIPFGGASINDVVIHIANNHMGFGGFAESGIGAYHGKTGFDCFTHYKSTLRKSSLIEMPIRVPPFNDTKLNIIKLLMH